MGNLRFVRLVFMQFIWDLFRKQEWMGFLMVGILRFLAAKRDWVSFLLVATIALSVVLLSGNRMRYPDELDYDRLAQKILAGEGFVDENHQPTAFRPPGYPFVLSLLYRISNHPLTAKSVNVLCLGLATIVVYRMVKSHSPRGAFAVPVIVACYPLLHYASSTLYPQTLAMLILVLIAWLMTRFAMSFGVAAFSGVLLGLLTLIVPASLLLAGVCSVYMIVDQATSIRRRALHLMVFAGCLVLPIAPWTVRNYMHFGSIIPVSTNSGLNLLLGNSENSGPNSGVNADISRYAAQAVTMNEAERDRYFRQCAMIWMAEHPARASALYVRKVLNYFNFRNELFTRSESNWRKDLLVLASYYPLLFLALLRLLLYRVFPLERCEWLLCALYFGNAFLAAIFFTRIRFRIPFDMLLVAIVSIFLGKILVAWSARQRVRTPAGI